MAVLISLLVVFWTKGMGCDGVNREESCSFSWEIGPKNKADEAKARLQLNNNLYKYLCTSCM